MARRTTYSRHRSQPIDFPPPITVEQLREQVAKLDIPGEAARLALSEQGTLDENQPSSIEVSINGLFDKARAETNRITIDRIRAVDDRANHLGLSGDEVDFSYSVKGLAGDLAQIQAQAEIDIRPLIEEQAGARRAKGAFLSAHQIFEPTIQPSLFYWFSVALAVAFAETFVTAYIYAPVFGDDAAFIVAGLIGASMIVAGVIISFGILLTQHRRTKFRVLGPVAFLGGIAFFFLVAMCAAHLRVIISEGIGGDADAAAVLWNAVRTATAIASSLWNRAQLPITDPTNLGFIAFSGLSVSFFVYETHRTWGYWGFRRLAIRALNAVSRMTRRTKEFVEQMKGAGKRTEQEMQAQVERLLQKDQEARDVTNQFMSIIASHSVAVAAIDAEHHQALATFADAYQAAFGRRKFSGRSTRVASGGGQGLEFTVPADFDKRMKNLRRQLNLVVRARAEAQAEVDTNVANAVRALGIFVAKELARASGVPYLEDMQSSESLASPPIDGEVV